MKKLLSLFLCLCLFLGVCPMTSLAAPEWPSGVAVQAEGGIVMDADSGAVLFGQNIHEHYFPASITKILTALIVIENCDLDETVTFSRNAVYNVESGSSNAGLDTGDTLSVRDALYAMLLKSANEAANALAEHTAGSIEDFAQMMNDKAAALGCTDSHFCNPSGLNNPDHYTSAYDMALIAQAAFKNETFIEIDSSTYHDLPATKRAPDGQRIYPGHKMLRPNSTEYYDGIIGGKTGYTTLAGNTLVTCAERNGLKLISVVLNGHQTHYSDTRAMLNFGFTNFKSVNISESDPTYASISTDLSIAGLPVADISILGLDPKGTITLPQSADISDATSSIAYELPTDAPAGAVARISYDYNDRMIGSCYLMVNPAAEADVSLVDVTTEAMESSIPPVTTAEEEETETEKPAKSPFQFKLQIPAIVWIVLGVVAALGTLIGGIIFLKVHIEKKEELDRLARYQRRQQRLQDIGISSSEFDLMLENRRRSALPPEKNRFRRKRFGRH